MALYPELSFERSEKINQLSDEMGRLSRIICEGCRNGRWLTSNNEHLERLNSLKKDLDMLIEEYEELKEVASSMNGSR